MSDSRTGADAPDGPVCVRLSDVQAESVRWLWPGRIALGKLTILSGDPGNGKSMLTIDLAARVSCGSPWPDDPTSHAPRGDVVLMNCEDDLADTVRPRLDAAGADAARIVALSAIRSHAEAGSRDRSVDLSRDLESIEQAIRQVEGCRLVVIDPISAYLGGTDSHKNAEVRSLLAPLAEIASRHGVAIVAVDHMNKGAGKAIYRSMGSIAFVAAARSAWAVARDRQTPGRRLFLPLKNNLAADATGLAFAIVDGKVCWEPDPVSITADEALAAQPGQRGPEASGKATAVEWLRGVLSDGPRLRSELSSEAEASGISERTLRRAQRAMGVKAFREITTGPWLWRLPDGHMAKLDPGSK